MRKGSFALEEQYWREIISKEIMDAIDNGSEINAYGAYLIALGKRDGSGDYDYY
jgi:hypothetical protein